MENAKDSTLQSPNGTCETQNPSAENDANSSGEKQVCTKLKSKQQHANFQVGTN